MVQKKDNLGLDIIELLIRKENYVRGIEEFYEKKQFFT